MKPAPVAAILLFIACGGCSMALDENSGVYAAQPGKYDFLDCPSLLKLRQTNAAREAEIAALMERASQGGGGAVVNALVYRDQLNLVRGDRQLIQRTSDEKRCTPDVKLQNTGLRSLY
jgi:hypothetical protein